MTSVPNKNITSLVYRSKKDFENLGSALSELKNNYGVIGIKQSFEDEGAIIDDVITMRRITELNDVSLYVKIGGPEALSDISNCVSIGVDSIIAPMIETEYAFSKYAKSIKDIKDTKFYLLCETKTCYENIEQIFTNSGIGDMSGLILGRSDFTKSYGLKKEEVDSDFICEKAEIIFQKSKSLGITTTMGGNISLKSCNFITNMFQKGLLDKIETRNVVIGLNNDNIANIDDLISQVLRFEIQWLQYKAKYYNSIGNVYTDRVNTLMERI